MSQEQNSSKQKLEEELGQLLLSFLNGASDEEREQCLRFIESTLRRLVVLRRESRAE
jgi:hypothetical protein